jgi:hypothetical protein
MAEINVCSGEKTLQRRRILAPFPNVDVPVKAGLLVMCLSCKSVGLRQHNMVAGFARHEYDQVSLYIGTWA